MAAAARTVTLLLAAAALSVVATVAAAAPACETANCGKGRCVEQPGPFGLDTYRCDCDAGWSNMFKLIPASPCTIPNCTFDRTCFNTSITPPRGIPLTDPCGAINCSPGGECVKEEGFSTTAPARRDTSTCSTSPGCHASRTVHSAWTAPRWDSPRGARRRRRRRHLVMITTTHLGRPRIPPAHKDMCRLKVLCSCCYCSHFPWLTSCNFRTRHVRPARMDIDRSHNYRLHT
ncbi:hypothetical protein E2562_006665 [Oryza meyeriana var. granulata]|uniref:EGF-like domain-containing protein n=1 Tax=Oryza meyeriana var. granulata TaxID=110450 RepID=A0A6G1EG82_9ORYZ|nr:hypothetical protein E2562_006665 [Oryza meyeriana var. granulata]